MSKNNQKTPWWVFYPLKGFDITDLEPDLDSPIFGDTTIVSKSHMDKIVSLLNLNERMAPGHDHEASVKHLAKSATFKEDFQSYVAVRRIGYIPSEERNSLSDNLIEATDKRASQISALISLAVLSNNKEWKTCGLVKQVHRQVGNLVMLSPASGGFCFTGRGERSRTIVNPKDNIKYTRAELKTVISSSYLSPLSKILGAQRPKVGDSLRKAVSEASIRLSDALHTPSAAGLLLGSVTAIEILLANLGDSFDSLKKRIQSLIGEEAYFFFDSESVLNQRHLYVHRGIEPDHDIVPIKASALALSCLIAYSELATSFPAKNAILAFLDLQHQKISFSNAWSMSDDYMHQINESETLKKNFPFFVNTEKHQG